MKRHTHHTQPWVPFVAVALAAGALSLATCERQPPPQDSPRVASRSAPEAATAKPGDDAGIWSDGGDGGDEGRTAPATAKPAAQPEPAAPPAVEPPAAEPAAVEPETVEPAAVERPAASKTPPHVTPSRNRPVGGKSPGQIPSLNWEKRSDWIDVTVDVVPPAVGDGVADDSAAVQAALDMVKDGSTVYLPKGAYRITVPLILTGPRIGVTVIGHGRDSTLVWDGEAGGKLYTDDGIAHSRYEGLTFEGKGKASVGFYHHSNKRFETEVRHVHLAFRNFTDAAVRAEKKDKYALAETEFRNCLFENCKRGVVFVSFNDYDFTFDGCEFRRCGYGLVCSHGNFYARDCHFEASGTVDIKSGPEHAVSVRRCTSFNSKQFIQHSSSVSPMTIQDCQVAGWRDPRGAVVLNGAPVTMFDCAFTHGPAGRAPVMVQGKGQRVIASENRAQGSGRVFAGNGRIYRVPAGKSRRNLTSARQRFLKDTVRVPTKVFDAKRDFGAVGNGRADDTAAIQKAIDAARAHGDGAIAYLPSGRYVIKRTLLVTGRDYYVGGTGFRSCVTWKGPKGGTMVEVHEANDVTLEHIAIGNHDSGKMDNDIDILQTGSKTASRVTYDGVFVFGMYQKNSFKKGLHLRDLGPDDTVVMPHVQGNIRIIDSADATILGNCTYEGAIVVEGKDANRGGLIGFMTRLSTHNTHGLYLRDNHSIVMSDFYVEQADNGFVLEGTPGLPAGRATIAGAKVDFFRGKGKVDGTVLDIRNYHGEVFLGPDQFYASLPRVPIVHEGTQALRLYMLGNCFYKTHLEVKKKPSLELYFVGNHGLQMNAKKKDLDAIGFAKDNLAPGALAPLARALDDYRRLGETDLRLNHEELLPE